MSIFFTKTETGYSHINAGKRCQDFSASYSDEERTIVTACTDTVEMYTFVVI